MKRWPLLLFALVACKPTATTDAPSATLALAPCRVRGLGTLADCATLEVAENPDAKDGRQLGLRVVVVAAPPSEERKADPLFLLAGGPGQAATEAYAPMLHMFRRVRRHRDIVMIDQRGTGQSAPLDCALSAGLEESLVEGAMAKVAKACRNELDADLTQYSTERAANDIEAVRVALGYGPINIFGASYGTRLALEFVRRHPESVRSVVIDGVAPRAMKLPLSMAKDGQRALDGIFAACAEDAACKAKFGDLAKVWRELLTSFPRLIHVRDPRTAEPVDVTLTRPLFVSALRGLLYSPELTSLLPLTLRQAHAGDFQGFIAQASLLGESSEDMMSLGLFLSVVCGEDVALISDAEIAAQTDGTFLGRTMVDELRAACDGWPRPELAPDFAEPVRSDVPVLALSGELDPVTPPAWGDAAVKHLSRSRHLVVPGAAHGTVVRGCTAELIDTFIDEPATVADIDASCLDEASLDVPSFFIDYAGPPH